MNSKEATKSTTSGPLSPSSTSELWARRGSQWLSPEDLQAHLAALARLENIAVLLGSGASSGKLGGLTVPQLWKKFTDDYRESHSYLTANKFVDAKTDVPNVENLLDAIEIAYTEWTRADRKDELEKLKPVRANLQRVIIQSALLNSSWWKDPASIVSNSANLEPHRRLLHKLTAARQPGQPSPWVFTTNYDLAVEWAAESIGLKVTNGFDGLHNRAFAPHNFDLGYRNTLARGEARFGTYNIYLVKLHGSLSWTTSPDGLSFLEFPAAQLWNSIESFLSKPELVEFHGPIVFLSAAKYLQTVGFVLGELLRRFTDVLARPQTAIITSGYSFSDEHVNRIIATALQNPTLQLVIYLPDAVRTDTGIDLANSSMWIKRIVDLSSPQVTIVGGGQSAYFDQLVNHLPEPAIYDEQANKIREMLRSHLQGLQTPNKSVGEGEKS